MVVERDTAKQNVRKGKGDNKVYWQWEYDRLVAKAWAYVEPCLNTSLVVSAVQSGLGEVMQPMEQVAYHLDAAAQLTRQAITAGTEVRTCLQQYSDVPVVLSATVAVENQEQRLQIDGGIDAATEAMPHHQLQVDSDLDIDRVAESEDHVLEQAMAAPLVDGGIDAETPVDEAESVTAAVVEDTATAHGAVFRPVGSESDTALGGDMPLIGTVSQDFRDKGIHIFVSAQLFANSIKHTAELLLEYQGSGMTSSQKTLETSSVLRKVGLEVKDFEMRIAGTLADMKNTPSVPCSETAGRTISELSAHNDELAAQLARARADNTELRGIVESLKRDAAGRATLPSAAHVKTDLKIARRGN